MLREHPADVIVSVHSVMTRPAMKALMSQPYRPPFVVVVTDLVSTHHLWYDRRVERCLVPTRPAYVRGQEAGLLSNQMRITGLPVHPRFVRGLTDKASARTSLNWDPNLPAVLLIGGGEGMGPLYKTALTINDQRLKCQLVIVAGRNETLKKQLEAQDWNQPTLIYGFRSDMPVLMAATDILVSKAGPATITEAGIAGLPVILYDAIPGQETGNVEHVVSNDVGVFAPTAEDIAKTLTAWLAEGPAGLRKRSERAKSISRPNAVFDIAEEIWHYAQQNPIAIPKRELWKEVADATRLLTKEF
jgi:1,2-diacylglycerol 3-beta-galactosyltransferase